MKVEHNAPVEIIQGHIESGTTKGNLPLGKMILLGIMAGVFISLGAATSNTAVHDIANVGIARVVAGVIFPVGLIMIVLCGGELFTGNSLMVMSALDKKLSWRKLIKNYFVVYLSNMAGALIIDVLVYFSGNLNYTDGTLGAYTIKVALTKMSVDPVAGVCSGILCNILVCMAIMVAGASRDMIGKLFGIFFPIFAFVVGGFEHCVANMYYMPTGILATMNEKYVQKAQELYGITAEQIAGMTPLAMFNNLIPVTIGNLIGGALAVGVVYYVIHTREWKR